MTKLDLSYFLTGNCTGGTGKAIECTPNEVTVYGEMIVQRSRNKIFAYGNNTSEAFVLSVLNTLGYTATFKDGKYTVNGLDWDGSKVNLELFND